MLSKFINRSHFDSYEDFRDNFHITCPENFNFSYDVVDVLGQTDPQRRAMVWCGEDGETKIITFADLQDGSNRNRRSERNASPHSAPR